MALQALLDTEIEDKKVAENIILVQEDESKMQKIEVLIIYNFVI